MAASSDGFVLTPGGLAAASYAAQQALDTAVTLALRAAAGQAGVVIDDVWQLVIPRPAGGALWSVEVLPLRAGSQGAFAARTGAVILVADTEARRRPPEELLIQSYSLTPAEASRAASLVEGLSLAEHAQRRGITLPTARTQLAHIFRKTGCRQQSERSARLGELMR